MDLQLKQGFLIQEFLIPPHTITNLGMQKNYQNETKFNEVYSGDNLANKIK